MWPGDPFPTFCPTQCSHTTQPPCTFSCEVPDLSMCLFHVMALPLHPVTHPLLLAQKGAFPVLSQVMVRKPGCEHSLSTVRTWIFLLCFCWLLTIWINLGLVWCQQIPWGNGWPLTQSMRCWIKVPKLGVPTSRWQLKLLYVPLPTLRHPSAFLEIFLKVVNFWRV